MEGPTGPDDCLSGIHDVSQTCPFVEILFPDNQSSSLGVSILSPAHSQFIEEFGVGSTVAILPLSLYVFALALGPVVGGPLSETFGRYPIYIGSAILGSAFTLGVGLSNTFTAVCVLRFFAGLCFATPLAIAAGTINETFRPASRAIPSTIFILTPFLGPGIGQVSILIP
jgi:MFS family permease